MVQGRISFDEAEERVIIETRQYAKRQRTWFRHQLADAHVTSLGSVGEPALEQLRAWWVGAGA
jgi:tRNA dimethylallyltransferase